MRSAESYTAAARREVSMLAPIRDNDPTGIASHCVRLLDAFDHEGPNGRHVVEVFEAMGDDLLALIRWGPCLAAWWGMVEGVVGWQAGAWEGWKGM